MRLLMSVTSVLLLAVAVNGCSDSVGPRSIAGVWEEDGSLPGSSLEISLALNTSIISGQSTISGQGSWCGEALGCGLTSTTGTVTGDRIHLVTTFDNGQIETFDGTLTSSNTLAGSGRDTSPGGLIAFPHAQSFHRLIGGLPRTQ
jgi:hypothetical protein